MKIFSTVLASTIGLYASFALAVPTCNAIPYGSKCTQCSSWVGHNTWSQIACNLNNNPTKAPGFACNTASAIKKCGVIVKKADVKSVPKEKLQAPEAELNLDPVKK